MYRLDEHYKLASVPAADGFLYGYGTCTTFVLNPGEPILCLEKHYQRLVHDCRYLNLTLPWPTYADFTRAVSAIAATQTDPTVARLSVVADGGMGEITQPNHLIPASVWLSFRPVPANDEPVLAKSVIYSRPFPQVKHINYLGELVYMRQARAEGYNELLRITPEGHLSEFATANVFVVTEFDSILTPSLEHCLPGTTRDLILNSCAQLGIRTSETTIPLTSLSDMKGVFLSNAVRGAQAVRRVDQFDFTEADILPLLNRLRDTLTQLAKTC